MKLDAAPLERRRRQPLQAKRIAVGFDRGEQKLAPYGRADLAHAVGRARPAGERRAAALPRPHVVGLAVIGDEEDFIRRVAEARRVLDRFIGGQNDRRSLADINECPPAIAQARDHHAAPPGRETADALARRGAVERAHGFPFFEHDNFGLAGGHAEGCDATAIERRGKAVAGTFRNPGTAAARVDVMQVVEQVVVAADLEL